jgi:hypothetical protein
MELITGFIVEKAARELVFQISASLLLHQINCIIDQDIKGLE